MSQKPTFVNTEMENKGITKKQFRIQSISSYFNLVLGLIWIWIGIEGNHPFQWILGIVFILLSAGSILSLYLQWKRHPVVDEELDRQATQNFKESLKGMAITIGIIIIGFLLAFGLVRLFT